MTFSQGGTIVGLNMTLRGDNCQDSAMLQLYEGQSMRVKTEKTLLCDTNGKYLASIL